MVHNARVPECVAEEMAAPNQEGSFPSPVKFGYLSVGVVEDGPADWLGKTVFCLYPHQDRYIVPVESLTVVPEDVPARRAVLTGTVETAINGIWEAGPRLGDRVAVIGAGLVGGMVAKLLARSRSDGCSWWTSTRPSGRSPRPSASSSATPTTPCRTATS